MWGYSCSDGHGETSEVSCPLREGEVAEWILLDGMRCVHASVSIGLVLLLPVRNVALHNLYPDEIDLVVRFLL
ncbi:hypothetical protein M422DRAFT_36892 [Sphaerobolus stellatus SS14]|uniref:Uncharacterized protein n=1 Tax=Sphaerobolus stellatus (strain SS14) TaxID=990650 RepID=A0A0C9UWQ4_SPHS4|nr:hypothetical protein M422DRAFT_36892 [Sphaerobolus stellatus SS14]